MGGPRGMGGPGGAPEGEAPSRPPRENPGPELPPMAGELVLRISLLEPSSGRRLWSGVLELPALKREAWRDPGARMEEGVTRLMEALPRLR